MSLEEPKLTDTQVAIVGGGLSGLNAARLMQEAGADLQPFEARDRVGGRILTVDDRGAPSDDGFDLGPSWIWSRMQPASPRSSTNWVSRSSARPAPATSCSSAGSEE